MAGQFDFSDVDALNNDEKYGSIPQQALAGAEGIASGATFGASKYLEAKTGLTSLKDIESREDVNPATSILGNVAGAAGLVGLTGGIAAPAESGLLAIRAAPIAARTLAYGAEGAAFGLGTNLVDYGLGDQDLNAQKIAADMGVGFLVGGGLGALSHGLEARLGSRGKAAAEAADNIKSSDLPDGIVQSEQGQKALANGDLSPNPNAVVDPENMGIAPKSLEDIEARIKDAGYRGQSAELPTKDVLTDAISRVNPEMGNAIIDPQIESVGSQDARNVWNIAKESDTDAGRALRTYESLQKNELVGKTDRAIQAVAPDATVTGDATKAGERAIDIFKDNYQDENKTLAPVFEALKNTDINTGENVSDHLPGVVNKMTDAVPNLARAFDTTGDEVKMLPYKTSMGVDRATYSAVKDVVESIKDKASQSFEDLWNIRKGLDQHVDVTAQGQAPSEIRSLKKSLMDYMTDQLQDHSYDINAREAFKRYAINEQERQVVEKAFGASVGAPEFGSLSKVKPEQISDKIFNNTATVKAAKSILKPEEFNELLANHLAEQKALATDKGVFSSNKFASYMKRNQDVLAEAFKDSPSQLQKFKDYMNIMRILPDAPSGNPSGTAKTLVGLLKGHSLTDIAGNLKKYLEDKVHDKLLQRQLNNALAGKAEQAQKLSQISKIVEKTTNKIDDISKSIFDTGSYRGLVAGALKITDKDYKDNVKQVKEMAYDPQKMIDHLGNNSKEMYAIAPNITGSLQQTLMRGIQFLNSKIPAPMTQRPLSAEYKPSPAQMFKFNTYFQAVEDPMSVMGSIKNGDLTNESLEALQAVHPQLYQDMKSKIMENFDMDKAKKLNYATKMSLSKFLGEPLDEHMMPQAMMSYQQSMAMPAGQPNGIKPTSKGVREIDKAGRVSTRSNMDEET